MIFFPTIYEPKRSIEVCAETENYLELEKIAQRIQT
jgi:hypothetical protein